MELAAGSARLGLRRGGWTGGERLAARCPQSRVLRFEFCVGSPLAALAAVLNEPLTVGEHRRFVADPPVTFDAVAERCIETVVVLDTAVIGFLVAMGADSRPQCQPVPRQRGDGGRVGGFNVSTIRNVTEDICPVIQRDTMSYFIVRAIVFSLRSGCDKTV